MPRNFTVIDADQRSEEWKLARIGRLTGSRASDVLATIKSGEAAARRDYRMQLVTERLTRQPQDDTFVNAAMQRGIDCEPLAFAAYEALTGDLVQRTGFLRHNTYLAGCSLDGHVGDFDGLIELKAPKSATHLRYLRSVGVPVEHLPQLRHNLWITGAAWVDFVSFDDRFPDPFQLYVARLTREQAAIPEYEKAALAFLAEVERECQAMATMLNPSAVLAEAAL